jgi:hypothetical protein
MRDFEKLHKGVFRLCVRTSFLVWFRNFRALLSKAVDAVAQLVKTLRYKLKVVSLIPDSVIGMTCRTEVYLISNRNEFQEYFLGLKTVGA